MGHKHCVEAYGDKGCAMGGQSLWLASVANAPCLATVCLLGDEQAGDVQSKTGRC
jgi:hypothetical protein